MVIILSVSGDVKQSCVPDRHDESEKTRAMQLAAAAEVQQKRGQRRAVLQIWGFPPLGIFVVPHFKSLAHSKAGRKWKNQFDAILLVSWSVYEWAKP